MIFPKKFIVLLLISAVSAIAIAGLFANAQRLPEHININRPARHSSAAAANLTNDAPTATTLYLTFDADMTAKMRGDIKKGKVKFQYDPELISYIEANQIPSTFFVTGMFGEVYPAVIKDLASKPYIAIENHSYDHPGFESPCFGLRTISSDAEKISQMQKTQTILAGLTGKTPLYFRHPGLCHNKHDDVLAGQFGLAVADTGMASGDPVLHNSGSIAQNVLQLLGHARSDYNGVIIFHMGGPNTPGTAGAIKNLIPILQAKGYKFGHL